MQSYRIECNNQMLYKAKMKALKLLGEDHKTSYSKLFRYMHALLNFNPNSIISLERIGLVVLNFPHLRGSSCVYIDSSRKGFN